MAAEKSKKIDGIKKLNKEEAAKSRRIVLEMIGEAAEETEVLPEPEPKRSVDGLPGRAAALKKPPEKKTEEPEPALTEGQKKSWRAEVEKFLPGQPKPDSVGSAREGETFAPDFIKQAASLDGVKASGPKAPPPPSSLSKESRSTELAEKEKAAAARQDALQKEKADRELREKAENERARKEKAARERELWKKTQQENAQKERLAREQEAAERTARERAAAARQAEQARLAEERKKQAAETKRKKAAEQEARRRSRQERRQKFYDNLRKNAGELRIRSLAAARDSIYYLAVAAIMFSLFYSILAVAELKFDVDNRLTRGLSDFVPVPAIVTKHGLIEYYEYKDMLYGPDEFLAGAGAEPVEEIKYRIARKIVRDKLKSKYGNDLDFDNADTDARLAEYLVHDNEVNLKGISRITSIKKMIDENGDFVQIASKYGDELGQVTITPANRHEYPFSEQVERLAKNEISGIVYTPEGYYIFRCYEKTANQTALSYAFVRAKTLDQYIEEAAQQIKMWSLVR